MSQKEIYEKEFALYKDIIIEVGEYSLKSSSFIKYEVISYTFDKVVIKNTYSGTIKEKTGHWARKNLIK